MEKSFKIKRGEPFIFAFNDFWDFFNVQEKDDCIEDDCIEVNRSLIKIAYQEFNQGTIALLFLIIDLAIKNKMLGKPVNIIYLSPEIVKERIGVSKMTFYRNLKPLLENKILIKIKPNIYEINSKMIR